MRRAASWPLHSGQAEMEDIVVCHHLPMFLFLFSFIYPCFILFLFHVPMLSFLLSFIYPCFHSFSLRYWSDNVHSASRCYLHRASATLVVVRHMGGTEHCKTHHGIFLQDHPPGRSNPNLLRC